MNTNIHFVVFVLIFVTNEHFLNGQIQQNPNITFPTSVMVGHIFCDVRQQQAAITFNESVKRIKLDGVVPNTVNFGFSYLNGCDDVGSLNASLVFIKESKTDVILGPESTDAMQVSALLSSLRDVPIIGYASFGDTLSNKTKFSTLIRVSFGMGSLGEAVGKLLKKFQWLNVALIRSNVSECVSGLSGVYSMLNDPRLNLRAEIVAVTQSEIDGALTTVAKVARVIILCYGYEPWKANSFLKQAYNKSMVNPEYMYIIPYFLKTRIEDNSARPWEGGNSVNNSSADKQLMQEIYNQVLVVQASGDESSVLDKFKTTIEERAAEINVNSSISLTGKEPLYLPMLHDALYMYALCLNHCVVQGLDYKNGDNIFEAARRSIRFKGVTGFVTMDNSSDRYGDYDVYAMTNENSYEKMMTISAIFDNVTGDVSQVISDYRMDLFKPMPPDTPACGFTHEKCVTNKTGVIGGSVGASLGVVIILLILFFFYRKQKMEKDIFRMAWKLHLSDVKFMHTKPSNSSSLRSVGMGSGRSTLDSVDSKSTMDVIPEGDFKAMASVRGAPAFAKCWQRKKQTLIPLDRQQLLLLKQIKEIQHDNINNFLGAILDEGQVIMIFWKHCAKGSLHDLVMNEDILLDQTFTVSILNDVISGLDYMQNKSPLHYHGNLSVTNCLVDSRWVVKLTDFGWPQLHELLAEQGHLQPKMVTAHRLYHFSPEILRNMDPNCLGEYSVQSISMTAADIYSFAIIAYQVLFRTEPFSDDPTEPSIILSRIQDGLHPCIRPTIPKHSGSKSLPNLISLMQNCWAEDPTLRPSIVEIKRTMYSFFGKTLKRSLMDHVMSLLEKYATNLERIVEERTQQLELERKRADHLLYQMLPRTVADMLKTGHSVEPESYEWVTIYFSDIVGFTSLSSMSTPIQVVTMLNSLYSAFDESIRLHDVYKVETIGDAYMVVSGLPNRNGVRHVFEICDMALSILEIVSNFEIAHRPGERLRIRIGIHSGSVAAGVVGLTMPRYCLFGDAVNTASRMESNGLPLKIHVSEQTQELLTSNPEYILELRGQIELKGKGLCTTYWLLEKRKLAGMYQGLYQTPGQLE